MTKPKKKLWRTSRYLLELTLVTPTKFTIIIINIRVNEKKKPISFAVLIKQTITAKLNKLHLFLPMSFDVPTTMPRPNRSPSRGST